MRMPKMKSKFRARLLGRLKGKRVFRFPVEVTFGETASLHQVNVYPKGVVDVIAHTADDAANFVADQICHIPCVEVEVYGPQGGTASHRYWGWDRAIFAGMMRCRDNQMRLL